MHNVVVIGGYGAVGRTVWTELADHVPGRVFAAGRNVKKAETFSQETGGPVWPLKLDIANPSAAKALECARMVVACAEPGDASFAREVLERGIHYVDISASYAYLQQVERLDALARRRGATAVLSVGLSPGLTNLLARHCIDALGDELRKLDIFVLLGVGEAHGEAGVRWTIENLDKRFEVPGVSGAVGSFEEPRKTVFPGYGARTAYRFDFADQHILARTLGVEKVATRVCFDPAAAAHLLALAKRAGVLRTRRGPRDRGGCRPRCRATAHLTFVGARGVPHRAALRSG